MFENLNHFKSVVTHHFFVAPADNDYLLARWLLLNDFPELFWHSGQAIEKYLKAGLLINGKPVDKFSHHLSKLYEKHIDLFGDMAKTEFVKPHKLSDEIWWNEPVQDFIHRLEISGNPNSRYGLASWHRRSDDLFKIDQLCFSLRRLTINLGWIIGADFPFDPSVSSYEGRDYAEAISNLPNATPRGPIKSLDRRIVDLGVDRADVLHSWNYEFFREENDVVKMPPRSLAPQIGPMVNSYLFLFWQHLTSTDQDGNLKPLDSVFSEGMEWMIENIDLRKDVVRLLKEQINKPRG